MKKTDQAMATSGGARKTVLAVLGLAGLLVALWVLVPRAEQDAIDPPDSGPRAPAASEVVPTELSGGDEPLAADPTTTPGQREAASASESEPRSVPRELEGRVFHARGEPLANVSIASKASGDVLARSDDAGRFRTENVLPGADSLIVATNGYVTVVEAEVPASRTRVAGLVIVAAPAIEVGGRVVDRNRNPIAGAVLGLELPPELFARVPADLDPARGRSWKTHCDQDGRFRFENAPAISSTRLSAAAAGFRAARQVLTTRPSLHLVIVLERAGSHFEDLAVQGWVLHDSGGPAGHASVRLGHSETTTDEQGWFRLPAEGHAPDDGLVAIKKGYGPAVLTDFGQRLADARGSLPPVELVLGGPATGISGLLLAANREPCIGWRVKLLDGTVVSTRTLQARETGTFSTTLPEPLMAEDLAAGSRAMRTTNQEGEFAFEGLAPDRTYRLRAWNADTLHIVESDPIPSGTRGYVWRLPDEPVRERVDGIVVGRDGRPIENVLVRLTMIEHRTDSSTWMHTGQRMDTGADGRFEFRDVPRSTDLLLRFKGETVDSLQVDLAPENPGRDLRIEMARFGQFRFETIGGKAEEIAVLNGNGERMRMRINRGSGRSTTTTHVRLEDGRSPTLTVSEDAHWIVLLRGNTEIDRAPVSIAPGEIQVIQR